MMFVDYVFDVLEDGSIIMDKELKSTQLGVEDGDKYVVRITVDGRVVFLKVREADNG